MTPLRKGLYERHLPVIGLPLPGKRRLLRFALLISLVLANSGSVLPAQEKAPTATASPSLEAVLRFEAPPEGTVPSGWGGGPAGTIFFDPRVVHGGQGAVRIERGANSPGVFSSATRSVPLTFTGRTVELKGWLRTADVDGAAGLWMRLDGARRSALHFVSMPMEERAARGTTPWTQYAIQLPWDPQGRELYFGVLLNGTGTVWADDLELRVDGRPLAEAEAWRAPETAQELDREFDDGSGIDVDALSAPQIDNLALLGRVWGFLKYHHPRVAGGELHWDYELFRILPRVLRAADRDAGRRVLERWVATLGVPESCDPCATDLATEPAERVHLRPNLGWLRDTALLGRELSAHLRAIHRYRYAGDEPFHIAQTPIGGPAFPSALSYEAQRPPDDGYRILTLLRLWNIIEYWFPYRDLTEKAAPQGRWDAVLTEYLPRLVEADGWDVYRLQLMRLIVHVGDGHAALARSHELRPPIGPCQWPVRTRVVDGRAVVTEVFDGTDASGLAVGDVVTTVDGRAVAELMAEWAPFYSASNRAARLHLLARALPRGPCGPSTLIVERSGERGAEGGPVSRTLTVERLPEVATPPPWNDRPGPAFQRLSDPDLPEEVAYLKLSAVEAGRVASYLERAQGTAGWVIDIRNYPAEFVVFALGGHLVAEPTAFARFTTGDLDNPGAFLFTEAIELQPANPHYPGPVAVLVDESSLSQAEYTAMAFSAGPRAVVVGSSTAGADGNVSMIPLPAGLATGISGIGVFYPDKTPTQQVGIVPDVAVTPTVEGIRQGRDEVLEAALRHLLGSEADEAAIRRMARRP